MPALKYSDIFVPGGFPRHTYNPRTTLQLEQRLMEVCENLCKLATVTGHTKSGKTVLTRKVLPPEECVWIDGGLVGEEKDLWDLVVEQLELFQTSQQSVQTETAGSISAKAGAQGSLFVVKASGEAGASLSRKTSSTDTSTRSLSSRISALQGLR